MKTLFAWAEEVVELCNEIFENQLDQFCLHLWAYVMIERELLYNHVEVILKSITDEVVYAAVELWRDVIAIALKLKL